MTRARSELVSTDTTLYCHCVGRCVRRAYLCGEDFASGRSYEHRKHCITRRLWDLEAVFTVFVCASRTSTVGSTNSGNPLTPSPHRKVGIPATSGAMLAGVSMI